MPDLPASSRKHVFISYSRVDEAFAESLETRLRDLDRFDVKRDRRVLDAGEDWWRQLQEKIREADSLILCISPAALESPNVRREWMYAKQVGTRVVPVLAAPMSYSAFPTWLSRVHVPDVREEAAGHAETWAGFVETLAKNYVPHYAPNMARKPSADFVARPAEFGVIRKNLLNESGHLIAAIHGPSGTGKSALAEALCYDDEVIDWFYDGILWLTVSESGTHDGLLAGARDLITKMSGTNPKETTLDGIRTALRDAVSDRYVLVVLDDAWTRDYQNVFGDLGRHARVLVTTQKAGVLPDATPKTDVTEMKQSLDLIRQGLPDGRDDELGKFADDLGHWVQLIRLANGALRKRIGKGETLDVALSKVRDAIKRSGFGAISGPNNANERHGAFEAMIRANVQQLADTDRERFERLAVFAEDTSIPLEVLERLWGGDRFSVETTCEVLQDVSLLLSYTLSPAEIRLHDTIHKHLEASHRNELAKWHSDFLESFRVDDWRNLPDSETHMWKYLAYHLRGADKVEVLRELLLDFSWLQAKLNNTDAYSLLRDFDEFLDDRTHALVASAVRLSLSAVVVDRRQLAPQLDGRLAAHCNNGDIANLLSTIVYPRGTFRTAEKSPLAYAPAGGTLLGVMRHPGALSDAMVLSNGRILSWSSTLCLWDTDGEELNRVSVHSDLIVRVEVLSDGRLISISFDDTLRLWDSEGVPLRVLEGHSSTINGLKVLEDGRIVSWSEDSTLRLWDADGSPLHVLEGHSGAVKGLEQIGDGRLASWSKDGTLRLWDAVGNPLCALEGHSGEVRGLKLLEDGRLLSWAADATLRLWNNDGDLLQVLTGHSRSVAGVNVPTEGRLLSWSSDGTIRLWDSNGKPHGVLTGHTGSISGVKQLRDGRLLSWSRDGTLRLWDGNGDALRVLEGHTEWVSSPIELEDGRIVSWAENDIVQLWDADGTLLRVLARKSDRILSVRELSGGQLILGSADGLLLLLSAAGEPISTMEGHSDRVIGVHEMSDGRLLTWSIDNTLRLWDVSQTPIGRQSAHSRGIQDLVELEDGRLLSCSADSTMRIWNTEGTVLHVLQGHSDTVFGVLELGGNRLLSASLDGTLRMWDSAGHPVRVLAGHSGPVIGVMLLSDKRVLSWSDDHTLRLWSNDGMPLNVLEGHTDNISGAEELNDGKLVSWSRDGTLRVWGSDGVLVLALGGFHGGVLGARKLVNGRLVWWTFENLLLWDVDWPTYHVLEGHSNTVQGVEEVTGGRFVTWSGADGTMRLWSLDGEILEVLLANATPALAVRKLASGRLASWSFVQPCTMRIWSEDGELERAFEGLSPTPVGVMELSNGDLLTRSLSGALHLRDTSGIEVAVYYGDSPITGCIATSFDPLRVVLGDQAGRVMFLELVE